eukprot:scaffold23444_cov160-Amphora_coffeaeformis.AAC.1
MLRRMRGVWQYDNNVRVHNTVHIVVRHQRVETSAPSKRLPRRNFGLYTIPHLGITLLYGMYAKYGMVPYYTIKGIVWYHTSSLPRIRFIHINKRLPSIMIGMAAHLQCDSTWRCGVPSVLQY